MTDQNEKFKLKKRLKRTWSTFFVRFGRLLPIQELVVPVVLSGKNCIIVSSTASGKTEAVLAPLCEKILKDRTIGLSVLYITPTRALANDLYERLHEQMSELNMMISIKTGDKPRFNHENLPDILITTPESFDSLLCRHAKELENVKAVILDEIHILDGTYRGDQLRLLLNRLRKKVGNFSTYALSATVSAPDDVASRYMSNFEVIQSEGNRQIVESYVSSFDDLFEAIKNEHIKKVLVFCNSRAGTESVGMTMQELWGRRSVVVHHGSLSKNEREEAEMFIKESKHAICVSTMTLEIGIDIGNIDAVVLADVPWNVESFLQRIGRAGRRTGVTRVFLLSNIESQNSFEDMVEYAKGNHLEDKIYMPDLSVVVQQIFSILFSSPSGVNDDFFYEVFSDFCTNTEVQSIISWLSINGHVTRKIDKIYASEEIMNLGEIGTIHSNISNTKSFEIINVATNRKIGEMRLSDANTIENQPFILSGKVWTVSKMNGNRAFVKPSSKSGSLPLFKSSSNLGHFFKYLPEEIQLNEIGNE